MPSVLARTHGFARKSEVPGDRPRVCKNCDRWFAARPYERVCDGCVPQSERTLRLARVAIRVKPKVHYGGPGQAGDFSEVLGLFFRPGVPIYMQLAAEAAATERWSERRFHR